MKIYTPLCIILFALSARAQSGIQEFTTSGSFEVPDGVNVVFIEVVGAGGNGGGNGTGGGGGGGYASGYYVVTPGEAYDVTVGSSTLGDGITQFESILYATKGGNGVSVPNPEIGGGGAGGFGNGGTIANYTGGAGGGGYYTYFGGGGGGAAGASGDGGVGGNTIAWVGICLTPGGDGGVSGGLPGGNGGKGAGFIDAFCGVSDPSAPGANYGGGGGGGNGNGGLPSNGADGYCRVAWCAVDASTTLTATTITANASDATYQWFNCATGEIIVGETAQSYSVTETGSYAVIVTDAVCNDTSACVDVEIIIIGIADITGNEIVVAPNPFENYLTISGVQGDEHFLLYNATGQLIWEGNQIANEYISHLVTGLYFLHIENQNYKVVKNIIKQ